ncbi:MAG: hypothetical protein MJE77_10345 [Proteobacteria bacterium]|nr:hypothetical protein [Pseudomonadota bacterium]
MEEAKNGPSKHVIIGALVLACSHSRMRDIVGTDALRSVLDVEYRELIAGGTFDLQPVWELFEAQPGFDPQAAVAPLSRFKSWERQLGIEVTMPVSLRNLTANEQAEHAAECDVPQRELKGVLRSAGGDHADVDRTEPSRRISTQMGVELGVESGADSSPGRRLMIAVVASIVGLLGFGLAGSSAYRECVPRAQYATFSAHFAGQLPIQGAERFGREVRATLSDEGWLNQPEETRKSQLGQALRTIASQGIDVLFLRDKAGKVRAYAQLYDGERLRFVFK